LVSRKKILAKILSGISDSNIEFHSLCGLLKSMDFHERIKGSHHIFYKEGLVEILNIQMLSNGKAKNYQVKQVRQLILKYKLGSISE
jgi:hypothetical protein